MSVNAAIVLLGPPASGKSTLAEALTCCDQFARVFRLREHVTASDLQETQTDQHQLGWITDDKVVDALVRFVSSITHATHTVIFDNFPGCARQVPILEAVLNRLGVDNRDARHVFELRIPTRLIRLRAAERLVCQTCEVDKAANPRLPAKSEDGRRKSCARCGYDLSRRPTDQDVVLVRRISRFRENIPAVRAYLLSHGFRFSPLDASLTTAQLIESIRDRTRCGKYQREDKT